jgi:hypothetical protein
VKGVNKIIIFEVYLKNIVGPMDFNSIEYMIIVRFIKGFCLIVVLNTDFEAFVKNWCFGDTKRIIEAANKLVYFAYLNRILNNL